MSDSAGIDCDETLEDLAKDSGDIYEVKVNVHLVSGLVIHLCNHCEESYFRARYCGDEIYMYDGLVNIHFTDTEGNCHRSIVRPEHIIMIDSWNELVNWQSYIDKREM